MQLLSVRGVFKFHMPCDLGVFCRFPGYFLCRSTYHYPLPNPAPVSRDYRKTRMRGFWYADYGPQRPPGDSKPYFPTHVGGSCMYFYTKTPRESTELIQIRMPVKYEHGRTSGSKVRALGRCYQPSIQSRIKKTRPG